MALASLGATPGCDDPIRAAPAQRIIALAQSGERDPERLCEGALRAVGPPDPAGHPALWRAAEPPKADRLRTRRR